MTALGAVKIFYSDVWFNLAKYYHIAMLTKRHTVVLYSPSIACCDRLPPCGEQATGSVASKRWQEASQGDYSCGCDARRTRFKKGDVDSSWRSLATAGVAAGLGWLATLLAIAGGVVAVAGDRWVLLFPEASVATSDSLDW